MRTGPTPGVILLASAAASIMLLAGCAAPAPDATHTAPAPIPTRAAPATPADASESADAPVVAEVEMMQDAWSSATDDQRRWVVEQLEGMGDRDPVTALVEQAAGMGVTVSPEAAARFLDWLDSQ